MASRIKETFTKYGIDYGLSGQRHESAIRQFKLMLAIEILVIVGVFLFASLGYNTEKWVIFYSTMLFLGFILMFFRYRWRESSLQLWMDERRALKRQSADNLRDIEELQKTMKQQGSHDGSRNK